MANTKENLIAASKKGMLSPLTGKHGKHKVTLLREKAEENVVKSWEEKLSRYLPEDKVLQRASEGLDAIRIHTSHTEPDMVVTDYPTRHKYLETALELLGKKAKKDEGYDIDVRIGSLWLIKK